MKDINQTQQKVKTKKKNTFESVNSLFEVEN